MGGEAGVTQTLLAGREDGVPGNCIQAAVATLLHRPIEAVPHFLLWDQWNYVLRDWLAEQGLELYILRTTVIPAHRCVVAGMSPRGISHVCVADNGEIVWDPHPSRDGLTSIEEAWTVMPKLGATESVEGAVPGIAGSDGAQIAVQPRAGEHRAEYAGARGEGICRTCLAPIWNEGGTIGRQHRSEGWSDRIERGGDSLVCFKAVHYRHVPLGGREACIYDRAFARGAASKVTR